MLGSIYWAWSIAHRLLDQCNLGGMGFVWKLLGLINCTSPGSSKLCIWWFKMIVPSGPNPFTDNDLSFKANNWSFYVYGTLLSDFGFNAFLRNFTMIVSIWIDNSPQIFFLSSSSPFSSFFFFYVFFITNLFPFRWREGTHHFCCEYSVPLAKLGQVSLPFLFAVMLGIINK